MFTPTEIVEARKATFTPGTVVELVEDLVDTYIRIPAKTRGVVHHVDDTGTVFCHWAWEDKTSSLGTVYGVDVIRKIKERND